MEEIDETSFYHCPHGIVAPAPEHGALAE